MQESHREHRGKRFSEGSRLLWLAVENRGLNLSQAANAASCGRASFVKYLYGDSCPELGPANRLFDVFRVPTTAWGMLPSEDFVLPALRVPASESGEHAAASANAKPNGTEG